MVEWIVKHNCYRAWFRESLKYPKENRETAVQDTVLGKGSTQS